MTKILHPCPVATAITTMALLLTLSKYEMVKQYTTEIGIQLVN